MTVVEPSAEQFFASAAGVCVYVKIGHRVVRVQFESLGGPGTVEGDLDAIARDALAAASAAFERHADQLRPLFERIECELVEQSERQRRFDH